MTRRLRLPAIALATVGLAAPLAALPMTTTYAATAAVQPVVAGSPYLALGDSIVFGYREPTNLPTPDYTKPATFRGFPEEVASSLGLKLTNAGCPGETTSSFINKNGASNGCENHYDATSGTQQPGGYRTQYPLHTTYSRSQLGFAEHFLTNHPHTRLVTLMVGANDGFLCQASTSDGCVSEFVALLAKIQSNVDTILKRIRATGYTNQIVLVNYYSPDYNDSTFNLEINGLNDALARAAAPYHVRIASGFDAFQRGAAQASGDTCAAQLITTVTGSSSPCGVHPSVAGAALLAQAVEQRLKK